jgi:predicted dithiol-disulfide oxidoreductase (DUF899 family)
MRPTNWIEIRNVFGFACAEQSATREVVDVLIVLFGGFMAEVQTLLPARQLAATNVANFPNESAAYRKARNELLVEEIELRRNIERVAERRRALPPGGELPQDFELISESGPVRLSSLFGGRETLMVYSMMYGPKRKLPCPSCTSFLSAWNGAAVNLRERCAMAVMARSPIDRLTDYKGQRGFGNLVFFSDSSGDYTRTYVNQKDEDVPGFSVFTRRDGTVRHFYSGELSGAMSDPGQDPRGAPDLDPLWLMLDLTPNGRGTDWYPALDYQPKD